MKEQAKGKGSVNSGRKEIFISFAVKNGEDVNSIAARFHQTMVEMVVAVCKRIRAETGIEQVALSGGVFQNRLLIRGCRGLLADSGFEVLLPDQVPPHDGGLSYGQAAAAAAKLSMEGF